MMFQVKNRKFNFIETQFSFDTAVKLVEHPHVKALALLRFAQNCS